MGRGSFRSLHRLDREWIVLFQNHLFLRNLSCGIADKQDRRVNFFVPAFPMRVHAWYFSIAERSLSGIACMIPIQRMRVDRMGESIGAIDRFLLQRSPFSLTLPDSAAGYSFGVRRDRDRFLLQERELVQR